ncbi:MAG: DUF1016 family protein [Succinivibrio sp.]|nr:DUF1016 family protein [Succinivibrio sp.]
MEQNLTVVKYQNTGNVIQDVSDIILNTRHRAYQAVNQILVYRNYLVGRRIAEEELKGGSRAEYGLEVIKNISLELTRRFGKGYTKTSIYEYYLFYKTFPDFMVADEVTAKRILSWSHYRILLQVKDEAARSWYAGEALEQDWSVRTLQRNIDTQYYYRLLSSANSHNVEREMLQHNEHNSHNKLDYLKNPLVAEFLGLSTTVDMTETQLESAILSNLQKFLMELGKGYAFVARQQRIQTQKQDYYIDLVFYNFFLKCFVLIDLKIGKITHQDVGQMDMYIRMYDELKRNEGDNPTLGIVLCSETDADIARYSVMHGSEQLFATKYKLYLPTEDELRAEIETQKEIFYLQQKTNGRLIPD